AANGMARGTETFCWEYGGAGERLAASLQQAVWGCLSAVDGEFPDRGVKVRKDLCVLRVTEMPAALVELAFIDNAEDAALLMQYGAELGKAIAEGVMGVY
ncbi:MAG: N-acetylmuramoyl-L-alanine amidase, partial [Selenomonadaceae bacterium]|nr:N-acetylmuramoyl-L-alanine amidase [Selenomonadaceae bacterium]